ncbi:MAG: RnfABCDGE type electron transport complex subunit D, partial [Candidatus Omnitrophica bacterium]|nr:RnfABCDGE type electron transport complex subunit D [Candidatus Omnitrophota bacterium]
SLKVNESPFFLKSFVSVEHKTEPFESKIMLCSFGSKSKISLILVLAISISCAILSTILSFLLFGWQTLSQNRSLEDIWGYLSYFYIFIMVIEPKTSSIDIIGKYIFGIGLAIFIFVFTGLGARFDVELFSLLIMNASVPLLSRIVLKSDAVICQEKK